MPISPDTFDPLRRYVAVRLQRRVPILDVDWNERDDARRYELRAFLAGFVGDGVPEGSDPFRVIGDGSFNDFVITGGLLPTATSDGQLGLCLVDGLGVIAKWPTRFSEQPLHVSQPNAAVLAAAWGVPVVNEPPDPVPPRADVSVWLDVWERLVTPAEDPSLVIGMVGQETCARLKREWAVRAGDLTPLPGHEYLELARYTWRPSGIIQAGDVVDLRPRRLVTLPASIVEDTVGAAPGRYRQGLDRPAIDLRSAINALLRGERPATSDELLFPGAPPGHQILVRSTITDQRGNVLAFWTHDAWGVNDQVYAAWLDVNDVDRGFQIIGPITSGLRHRLPSATLLPNGEVVVVYQAENGDVLCRRGPFPSFGAEQLVATSGGTGEGISSVSASGDTLLFLFSTPAVMDPNIKGFWTRRQRISDGAWLDPDPVALPVADLSALILSNGIVDTAGRLWFASSFDRMTAVVLDIATGAVLWSAIVPDSEGAIGPSLYQASDGRIYFAWGSLSVHELRVVSLSPVDGSVVFTSTLPTGTWVSGPTLIEEADRPGLTVYYGRGSAPHTIQWVRLDPATSSWGAIETLIDRGSTEGGVTAIRLRHGTTLLLWASWYGTPAVALTSRMWLKRVISAL